MKELFNVTSASDDDDAIMKSFLGYASNLKNDLEKLEIHYSTQPAYPGKQVVASGKKLMTEVLQMKYSNEFFTGVDRKRTITLTLQKITSLLKVLRRRAERHC